jgi:hypothetical protein
MLRIIITIAVVRGVLESVAKQFHGFHDIIIFQDEKRIEDKEQPAHGQKKFGNKVYCNNLSMRSEHLQELMNVIIKRVKCGSEI